MLALNRDFDKLRNRSGFLFVIQYNGLEDYKLFYFFQNFYPELFLSHFLFFWFDQKVIFSDKNGKISGLIDQSAIGIFVC